MDFFQRLPKVELHTHLNGSIGHDTLKRLVANRKDSDPKTEESLRMSGEIIELVEKLDPANEDPIALADAFRVFNLIHALAVDEMAIRLIVDDLMETFAEDGVVYAEVRTTPRAEPSTGMTKRSYLTTVLDGFSRGRHERGVDVRLLLSFDRSRGLEDARDTLHLAKEFKDLYGNVVLGLDVSGDPRRGNLADYVPILEEARRFGLRSSVHLAEFPNQLEVLGFLKAFVPDRIGHGTCLNKNRGGSDEIESLVRKNFIPLELCLSSNVINKTVESYRDHHFKDWYYMDGKPLAHPVAICTDDIGVFKTNLSKEYWLLSKHFGINQIEMTELAKRSVNYIFADQTTKETINQKISIFCNNSLKKVSE